ncbi:hypothetical protein BGX27_011310 [Mortierella sp. AM989]|nr:hypothetical protein BGX27_011310 [Mortierella sp. AM989]
MSNPQHSSAVQIGASLFPPSRPMEEKQNTRDTQTKLVPSHSIGQPQEPTQSKEFLRPNKFLCRYPSDSALLHKDSKSKKLNIPFISSSKAKATELIELQKVDDDKHKDAHQTQQLQEHTYHNLNNHLQLPDSSSLALNSENAVEDLRVVSSYYSNVKGKTSDVEARVSSMQRMIDQRGSARLEQIRLSVFEFLSNRFSAHEYTVPRLFVVLPDDSSSGVEGSAAAVGATTTVDTSAETNPIGASPTPGPRYRLYFLCECSASFTLPLGSGLNHLHIAKHVGYGIDPARQNEFFKRYGAMVLTLLYYLKYGHDPSDSILSPLGVSSQASASITVQRQGQGIQQHRQQNFDVEEANLKKVGRISGLRRSDLPDSIAQNVDAKFDRMIEFLEDLRVVRSESKEYTQTDDNPKRSGHEKSEATEDEEKEDTKLHGIVSLSDLHHLYSFLGIANVSTRLQSGQLGNLYRISNVRGQVSWVCVYHYRWTFLERNIDEFERWVVARRGHFDKQSGSVSLTLFSRAHTRTFCSWIVNKMAPSLVEAHIKLGWGFGKKDLWRLTKALASSTVTVLSLDGCSYAEDSTYKFFHKKYGPILYLLTQGQLHSLELLRFPSLFKRLSSKNIKALSLRRLELGRGMDVSSKDRKALTHLLTSCTSLQELVLPGLSVTDQHMQAIMAGIRASSSLVTLDLSDSQLGDSAAIVLAQGLYNTHITQLDLSKNESLSDTSAARVIRAVGPRLTSLKMAQTGFGDLAAAALAKSMDGISFSNTLQDQLVFQNRLDVAVLVAGHRSGMRFMADSPLAGIPSRVPKMTKTREKTHPKGHLIYLDIEDNQCTSDGFKALAKVKSRLYFVYLNLSGSRELEDEVCSRILDRVASSAMMTLRLACTGFGNLSAKSLARALLTEPPMSSGVYRRMSGSCQLEELDLQACLVDSESLSILCDALTQSQALPYMKVLDLGHCAYLQDEEVQQFLKAILLPNGTTQPPLSPRIEQSGRPRIGSQSLSAITTKAEAAKRKDSLSEPLQGNGSSDDGVGSSMAETKTGPSEIRSYSLSRSDSDPTPQLGAVSENQQVAHPLKETLVPAAGFFTDLRQLDLKSTQIGDNCAWLLAQALVQPSTMLTSLTILDPGTMSIHGICWIVDAMCENSTVQEFGIGKCDPTIKPTDLELFGTGLINMMEMNKRIRSLTTLGAPLGAIAKGLLLNQNLHSVYLIRSKGQLEDMQLMGQTLAFTRSLLVYWMGGSDESLLGPLSQMLHYQRAVEDRQVQDSPSEIELPVAASSSSSQRQQFENHQKHQEQQQRENMYRDFHLLHNQDDQQRTQDQQQRHQELQQRLQAQHQQYQQHRLQNRQHQQHLQQQRRSSQQAIQTFGSYLPREISSAIKAAFVFQSKQLPAEERNETVPQGYGTETNSIYGTNPVSGTRPTLTTNAGPGGASGGNLSQWMRNPIIEGIRRNHSLIKVTLDSSISPSSDSNRPSPTGATTPRRSGAVGISRTSTWNNGIVQEFSMHELKQLQYQQQHHVQKKVNANRKTLKERGRIGWEELKILGVDDDVIQEVYQDP